MPPINKSLVVVVSVLCSFLILSESVEYPKFTTLIEDNEAVDSETLSHIVTDIDQHYDQIIANYSGSVLWPDNNSNYKEASVVDGLGDGVVGWGQQQTENDLVGWGLQQEQQIEQLHPFENSLSVEASGLKLALVLVSLWYLIIASIAAAGGGSLFSPPCKTNINPHTSEPQLIDANGIPEIVQPHPMNEDIINGFLAPNNNIGSSEEVEQMPMELVAQVGEICPTTAFFYGQNPSHMTAAMMLKRMLMDTPNPYAMLDMAMKIRPMVNRKMWFTGFMHACRERDTEMGGMTLPTALDAMPDSFIPGLVEEHDYSRSSKKKKKNEHCLKVDGTVGKDNGLENKLWYFREDVMVNSHHWYWHLAWPLMTRGSGRMDRRGELFYYAHRSFVQRYNIERLTHGLPPTTPLDYTAPVTPGYNPHLTDATAGQDWTPRDKIAFLRDINHQENKNDRVMIRIGEWLGRKMRLLRAIDGGVWVTPNGKRPIPPKTGIDMLGNTLEAVDISVNPNYYGRDGFHNDGHRILGYIEDPDFEKMLPPGVMADPATAMRDPIFYRFHTNINDIFERYKKTLKPYNKDDLSWPGVSLREIKVVARKRGAVNELRTFWSKKEFPLSMGLAFNRSDGEQEDVKVCAKHLDHEEFDYVFDVDRADCAKSKSNTATFRIFLAPKFDHDGRRLTIQEQRRLFVHLDLFNVKLPPGHSTITRASLASSLTIPYQQTLSQLNSNNPSLTPNCGCGWPHHLLLPKGTKKGSFFDLFVLITNGDDYIHPPATATCSKAFLYCGVGGSYYPDSRPMGFPFDREVVNDHCGGGISGAICRKLERPRRVGYVEEYLSGISNGGVVPVVIYSGK